MTLPVASGTVHSSRAYLSQPRFASYAQQLREILALAPQAVVEIGPGGGLVTHVLRSRGVAVTTVDVNRKCEPDVVASVLDIPLPDGIADASICFQVLEHLPFEDVPKAVRELARLSRKHVLLSLPDRRPMYHVQFRLPLLGRRRLSFELPRQGRLVVPNKMGHRWEVNVKGFPLKTVVAAIVGQGLVLRRTYRLFENPYHRFFLLEKA
jgi:hypothetical protein